MKASHFAAASGQADDSGPGPAAASASDAAAGQASRSAPEPQPATAAGPAGAGAPDVAAARPWDAASLRQRLVPPMPPSALWGWAGPLLVTLLGGILRFWALGRPHWVVFDETYYVPDAYSILRHGVEMSHVKNVNALLLRGSGHIFAGGPEYVVHPPLGKVMIAVGEWLFGLTPFGWRFAGALVGTAAILMVARIARRMTRSTLLGTVAGLLLALDGLETVLSRTAILDIFVMFWVLAAFGMLVLDRDAARSRLAEAATAPGANLSGRGPNLGIRWRRVLAGVFLGLGCATKWDAVWFIVAFGALAIAWDLGARKVIGYRARLVGVLRSDVLWMPVSFLVVPFAAYTAGWTGWFASSAGWDRNWAASVGNHVPIWSTLDSWYQYQKSMLGFGLGLKTPAVYTSGPWRWLYLGRPVSMYWNSHPPGCVGKCASEVLAIGTPAIWWASIPALLFCIGWWAVRRDWRPGAVLASVAAGYLPWFWFAWHNQRTEYYFYAVIFVPYLVLAITLCLGLIIGPVDAPPGRRAIGAVIAGSYVLLVLASYAYIYPLLTAEPMAYSAWWQRIWFGSWL